MRISKFLTAEELAEPYKIESGRPIAVEVDGDFTWEVVPSALLQAANAGFAGRGRGGAARGTGRGGRGGGNGNRQSWLKSRSKKETPTLPVSKKDADTTGSNEEHEESESKEVDSEKEVQKLDEKPFELKGLKMSIPKGAFVGIVGRVGSGKVRDLLLPSEMGLINLFRVLLFKHLLAKCGGRVERFVFLLTGKFGLDFIEFGRPSLGGPSLMCPRHHGLGTRVYGKTLFSDKRTMKTSMFLFLLFKAH